MAPMSICGKLRLGDREKIHEVCSAAEQVQRSPFTKLERVAVSVDFEFSGVSVFSKLANGIHELVGSGAEELSKRV